MSHEMLTTLDEINANANRLIGEVRDDQWSAPTPCTECTMASPSSRSSWWK